jgi:hypothetical protein
MQISIIAFIIVILLILFVVIFSLKNKDVKKNNELITEDCDFNYLSVDDCKGMSVCFEVNPNNPCAVVKRRATKHENMGKGANTLGADNIGPDEAIVLYGQTPTRCIYWSVNGYLYNHTVDGSVETIFAPVDNGINSRHFNNSGDGTLHFFIMTANPHVDVAIRKNIKEIIGVDRSINLSTINIPNNMYNVNARYAMMFNCIPMEDGNEMPVFKAQRIRIPGIETDRAYSVSRPPTLRYTSNERENITLEEWKSRCQKLLADKNDFKHLHFEPIVRPFMGEHFEEGIRSGYQCIEKKINGYGFNPDVIHFRSENFKVKRGQLVYIIAVDHADSGKGQYSQVTFHGTHIDYGYSSVITGNSLKLGRKDEHNKDVILRSIVHDPFDHSNNLFENETENEANIYVNEFIYLSDNEINTALPMYILVL